jgi:hypothetical protein
MSTRIVIVCGCSWPQGFSNVQCAWAIGEGEISSAGRADGEMMLAIVGNIVSYWRDEDTSVRIFYAASLPDSVAMAGAIYGVLGALKIESTRFPEPADECVLLPEVSGVDLSYAPPSMLKDPISVQAFFQLGKWSKNSD